MIFVNEYCGKYRILGRDGSTLANIVRVQRGRTIEGWPKRQWRVTWVQGASTEYFNRLDEIGRKYQFENYPGFGWYLKNYHTDMAQRKLL